MTTNDINDQIRCIKEVTAKALSDKKYATKILRKVGLKDVPGMPLQPYNKKNKDSFKN